MLLFWHYSHISDLYCEPGPYSIRCFTTVFSIGKRKAALVYLLFWEGHTARSFSLPKFGDSLAERGEKNLRDPNCQLANMRTAEYPVRGAKPSPAKERSSFSSPVCRGSGCTVGTCKQRRCDVTWILVAVFSKIIDRLRQNTYIKNCVPEQHWGTKLSEQDRILCTSPQSKYYHMCIKRDLLFTECWHETPWKS